MSWLLPTCRERRRPQCNLAEEGPLPYTYLTACTEHKPPLEQSKSWAVLFVQAASLQHQGKPLFVLPLPHFPVLNAL